MNDIWHDIFDLPPDGAGVILYRLSENMFFEGTHIECGEFYVNHMHVNASEFHAWCLRKDMFRKTNLTQILEQSVKPK